jgi:glutathione peroxidase
MNSLLAHTRPSRAAISVLLATVCALGAGQARAASPAPADPVSASCPALLQHSFKRLQDEAPQNLCQYSGKVLLVVNTASYCGFTPQYEGLEALYAKYAPRGLVIVGFPSNDFGKQEPGQGQQTGQAPGWNFHKYLIDRQGKQVSSFASAVEPGSPPLVKAIEAALAQP